MSDTLRTIAEGLLRSIQVNFAPTLEVVTAREADFKHLQLRDYAAFSKWMECRNFRFLSDIEIPQLTNSPTSLFRPTMIRKYLSSDGSTQASLYQTKPKKAKLVGKLLIGLMNRRFIAAPTFFVDQLGTRNYVGFETEFEDGSFLTTSNATMAGIFESPPSMDTEFLGNHTKPSQVLKRHKERLAEKRRSRNGPRMRILFTDEDARASQARQQLMKHNHRKSLGWYTEMELTKSANSPELGAALYAEIRNILGLDNDFGQNESDPSMAAIEIDGPSRVVTLHSNRMSHAGAAEEALSKEELVQFALHQGIAQVEAVGSPLNPFLIDEHKKICFLLDEFGDAEPMTLAINAIAQQMPHALRCAVVTDCNVTFEDGKKWDAISAMVCERGCGDNGEVWAQRYVPKGVLRKFRTEGKPELIAKSKDFISVALEEA